MLPDRIGVLGDVHCAADALEAALTLFRREGVERVLSVGDLVDGPGDVNRTLALLRAGGVEAVAGNHERWLLTGQMRLPDWTAASEVEPPHWSWLGGLPATRSWPSPAGRVLLCHGVAEDDMCFFREHDEGDALATNDAVQELVAAQRCEVMIGGHTHRRMVRRVGGVVFLNPGTLLASDEPCVVTIELRARAVREFDWVGGRFQRGAARRF